MNVYYDQITDQLWLCDGSYIYSEFNNELIHFIFNELFFSDEVIYLGEL